MKYEVIQKEGNSYALIPMETYQQLLEDSEMLADIKAYDQAKTIQEESFPLDIVEKISINFRQVLCRYSKSDRYRRNC